MPACEQSERSIRCPERPWLRLNTPVVASSNPPRLSHRLLSCQRDLRISNSSRRRFLPTGPVPPLGCYKHTPPEVVLAWFNDTLDVRYIAELNSGWILWNFRGPFGVLDTERPGTKFEDWQGHKLDRPLLTLLQQKFKA
jgi:hypothetical protein